MSELSIFLIFLLFLSFFVIKLLHQIFNGFFLFCSGQSTQGSRAAFPVRPRRIHLFLGGPQGLFYIVELVDDG